MRGAYKIERLPYAGTEPQPEPTTLAEAKQYCRVEIADDDALIAGLITAARLECEDRTNRSFIYTDWMMTLNYFPGYAGRYESVLPAINFGSGWLGGQWLGLDSATIRLPYPPLVAVSSIEYLAIDGTWRTLDVESNHQVVISDGTPGEIMPAFGTIFPITMPVIGGVRVFFTAGYGPTAEDVPQVVKQAILMLVSHYYEHRTEDAPEPAAINALLKVVQWGSYV